MFTHNVIMRNGSIRGRVFTGTGEAVAYGQAHRRVETIETVRGTVEYGRTEDGAFVNAAPGACTCHRESGSHERCCGHADGVDPNCPKHGAGRDA